MLSSKLLIALCDTDEGCRFVYFNQIDSLVRYMKDFRLGFDHVCGTLKPNESYLMLDVQLDGIVPDLLFEHKRRVKGKDYTERFYGYLMEEQTFPVNLK